MTFSLHSFTFIHLFTFRYLLATLRENPDNNSSEQLSEEKVVSWLCYVLDANFTRMIMSPDAGKRL